MNDKVTRLLECYGISPVLEDLGVLNKSRLKLRRLKQPELVEWLQPIGMLDGHQSTTSRLGAGPCRFALNEKLFAQNTILPFLTGMKSETQPQMPVDALANIVCFDTRSQSTKVLGINHLCRGLLCFNSPSILLIRSVVATCSHKLSKVLSAAKKTGGNAIAMIPKPKLTWFLWYLISCSNRSRRC